MDPFFFQNQGVNRIDLVVVLDKKLIFLADQIFLQNTKANIGLFKWGEFENKKVIFFFRYDLKFLEAAKALGARSALTVQTVHSLNPALAPGDVLLLDAQDGVYDTSLLVHLAPGFGVKKGYCVLSPREAKGLRLLGFRVVSEDRGDIQTEAALMNDVLQHLLVCSTADL